MNWSQNCLFKWTDLKIVGIEENRIGDVEFPGHDVWNDVGHAEDVVIVAVRVPVGAQLLVVQLHALVLHCHVVHDLKVLFQID